MKIDLQNVSGLPITFDTSTLEMDSRDGYRLERLSRTVGQLAGVLLSPSAATPETELYSNYYLAAVPKQEQQALELYNLSYSLVLMPPRKVGREYVKTMGHYHPAVPGTNLGFPEVYTQLFGTLVLLLQKTLPENRGHVSEFAAIRMEPGTVVVIPPDYAHVLVNISDEPGVMAGLYGNQSSFKPDYAPILQHCGLAYYLCNNEGGLDVEANPNYQNCPTFRWLSDLQNTPFEPVDPGKSVWSSYLENSELYAFLTQPSVLMHKFDETANV